MEALFLIEVPGEKKKTIVCQVDKNLQAFGSQNHVAVLQCMLIFTLRVTELKAPAGPHLPISP